MWQVHARLSPCVHEDFGICRCRWNKPSLARLVKWAKVSRSTSALTVTILPRAVRTCESTFAPTPATSHTSVPIVPRGFPRALTWKLTRAYIQERNPIAVSIVRTRLRRAVRWGLTLCSATKTKFGWNASSVLRCYLAERKLDANGVLRRWKGLHLFVVLYS